ncbi:glycosyltransferase [Grimontia hollisae]|uniref:glycosyltransferase n=1 Tax=Grimontia hollisae TaxID=673 RepID=UPI0012AD201D|nr:glycosyltransferase [Grimontia hollisae]
MKKIVIHYPFIPSYRVPVFNNLSDKSDIDVLFISALDSDDITIKCDSEFWRFRHKESELKTIRLFGRKLTIELGVLSYLIQMRGGECFYIALSNPNIITSWLYSLLAKILGYKVIFWGHGLLKREKGIKRLIRSIYYSIPDKHWLYGNNAVYLMEDLGVKKRKISVIYNSLNYEVQKLQRNLLKKDRKLIRQKLGYNDDDIVIICIGRLLEKLKIDVIIRAVELGRRSGLPLRLVIIGDGPIKAALQELVFSLNIDEYVTFTGALYREEDIGPYYISSDISAVAGVVGLAAMHSLAYGIPMITHNCLQEHCPEVEAIIPGYSGEFFVKDDLSSIIEAVKKVSSSSVDYFHNSINILEKYYTPKAQVEFMLRSINEF